MRRLRVVFARRRWVRFAEIATMVAMVVVGIATYMILTDGVPGGKLASSPAIAALLVANLLPAIGLLVLIGRRFAKRRARRSPVGGGGRLHARLVAIFSLIASAPILLIAIFASLLFQYGVGSWISQSLRVTIENAAALARQSYGREAARVTNNTVAMASDIGDFLRNSGSIDDPAFKQAFAVQLLQREMTEAMVLRIIPSGEVVSLAKVDPYDRDMSSFVTRDVMRQLRSGASTVQVASPGGIGALTPLPAGRGNFLYAARLDPSYGEQLARARSVLTDYAQLLDRSQRLQLQFNGALYLFTLLIVGSAVWTALRVADRVVRPVGALVDAARRVTEGDLSARVPGVAARDEIGVLAVAFNRMTGRLEEQTGDLERRRALIEAVLSGVSAGVLAVDADYHVRLFNSSAARLLGADAYTIGRPLAELAPELVAAVVQGDTEAVVQLHSRPDPRTLAVRVVADEGGHVLTFDDITQQLIDQRRAAWADVARRIAHEIKNPLTPIQLAAERLQRRYGRQIVDDAATFSRLTETIVRQVGDLRRMVDEFSSFARMPKPVFREDSLNEIARQAIFLHEVAHPAIRFALDGPPVTMISDRRQLGQAMTNLVKNACEAIAQQAGGEAAGGTVDVAIARDGDLVRVMVADSGIGLPAERDRLAEPYMTTRQRGTGLGLAIVLKIVEEHGGTLTFGDRPGGGAIVTMTFDQTLLAALATGKD